MFTAAEPSIFPRLLESYPPPAASILDTLTARIRSRAVQRGGVGHFRPGDPAHLCRRRFTALAHRIQHSHAERQRQLGRPAVPSVLAEMLHFFGEVEVVFGLWAIVLLAAITSPFRLAHRRLFQRHRQLHRAAVRDRHHGARLDAPDHPLRRGPSCGCWHGWDGDAGGVVAIILTVGPLIGSLITEPGAMTICALLLGRQF
jgi:hypothetical protein